MCIFIVLSPHIYVSDVGIHFFFCNYWLILFFFCRPYTACGGELNHIWHDWDDIDKTIKENLDSIDAGAQQIIALINDEVKQGIPMEKIVVGRYSVLLK